MQTKHKATTTANRKTPAHAAGMPAQYLLEAGGLLRLPQVLALVGVSRSTWWRLMREGQAPQSVKLGARCTAWRADDVAAFIGRIGNSESQA